VEGCDQSLARCGSGSGLDGTELLEETEERFNVQSLYPFLISIGVPKTDISSSEKKRFHANEGSK